MRVAPAPSPRPVADGKFVWVRGEKLYLRGVTYGTFAPGADGRQFPPAEIVRRDFAAMRARGFNAVRTYTSPPRGLLDQAAEHGLLVLAGVDWPDHVAVCEERGRMRAAERRVRESARALAGHPALLAHVVGNEIPSPLVRWHGHRRIERFVERLVDAARSADADALVTYANFPSTEYLELPCLDLVGFNVYLESNGALDAYLARLQHLAGDRPLVISEIGLDSRRHGLDGQAAVLGEQLETVFAAGCAGAFVFSWTDEWYRGGAEIDDWDFGLTDRVRRPKPALARVEEALRELPVPGELPLPRVSVVVCTYNGGSTLDACLEGLARLQYPDYEVIVVDDGSTDDTAAVLAGQPVRVVRTDNNGLSSARNTGLAAADGEIVAYLDSDASPDPHWLHYLVTTLRGGGHAGAGGPNIPPPAGLVAACVACAPGGPVHVLLSDTLAEHLPGCNMAFEREALEAIGGFDEQFRAAGDDVDICWRLQERGLTLGFSPAAVVWHQRRGSVRAYLRQQRGYGKAEALLERKWPEKYNAGGHVTWAGRLYGSTAFRHRSRIYHGVWGSAPFQFASDAPRRASLLAVLPEWYLVLGLLAGLTALGGLWPPLLFLALPTAAVAGGLLAAGIREARRARLDGGARPLATRLWMRCVIGALFVLQPYARLAGRLRHGLTPWRRRNAAGLVLPRPRTVTVWSERWAAPETRLARIEEAVRADGGTVVRGGPFDRRDLEVHGGVLGRARLMLATEEHGTGRQLLRFRLRPHVAPVAVAIVVLLAALAAGSGLDGSWPAAAILGGGALLVVLRALQETAWATAMLVGAARAEEAAGGAEDPAPEPPAAEPAGRSRAGSYFRLDIYRRLLPYFWPHSLTMALVTLLAAAGSALALANPWPLKLLVDSGIGSRPLPSWLDGVPFLSSGHGGAVIVFGVVLLFVMELLASALGFVEEFAKTRVDLSMENRFKGDLFRHLQRLSLSYHDRVPSSDSVYRVEQDSAAVSTLVWSNIQNIVTAAITFVGVLVILVRLDWALTLLALVSIPVSFLTVGWSSSRFREASSEIKSMESAGQTIVQEVLSCLRVVKAFGQERREQRRFEEQNSRTMRAKLSLTFRENLVASGLQQLSHANYGAILLLGAFRVHDGALTIGELLVVLAYLDHLYWPLETLGGVLTAMQLSLASGERTMEVLDLEPDVGEPRRPVRPGRVRGAIAFEHVTFAYPDGPDVLHDVDFSVEPGHVVAIVGPTGAGKTTVVNLIARFHDPSSGVVRLDGHDLRQLSIATLRDSISICLQEPTLFSTSIRENIAYGLPQAPLTAVIEAARAANAHEFITALPDGYETRVGEQGGHLSGGQRQRVAIARAFLKDAPVLVLDEPTSSVDVRTERAILDALGRLVAGRTAFIIAHRLSTVRHADRIIVLDHGRVVEHGSHDELVAANGLYAELHSLQPHDRAPGEAGLPVLPRP